MNLRDMGEFGLIARLRARWPQAPAQVVVGPGDDTAALRPPTGRLLLFTVDAMVEDVHFRRRWMPPRDLGWKALAQNVSDIAAMGGYPTHALVCLGLPGDLDAGFVDALYDGLDAGAAEWGATIVGGDVVGTGGAMAVSVSLLGEVEEGLIMLRSGAAPGDVVMVTGSLGDAAAGLRLLESDQETQAEEQRAVARHLRPSPRLDEARLLARGGQVTAAIDVSDGVAGDAGHVARESGVGLRLRAADLPISPACRRIAQRLGLDPLQLALRGGEDYELLVTVRPEAAGRTADFLRHETATDLTAIGEVVAPERGLTLVGADGAETPLGAAFDHFGRR